MVNKCKKKNRGRFDETHAPLFVRVPLVRERLLEAIKAGNYRCTAAGLAGITQNTLNNWLRQGAEGREPYASFAKELLQLEFAAEALSVGHIAKAEAQDWKAAAWRLERRYPERYAPHLAVHMQVQKELEKVMEHLEKTLPKEDYENVLKALAGLDRSIPSIAIEGSDHKT